jgi:hypothetical protein
MLAGIPDPPRARRTNVRLSALLLATASLAACGSSNGGNKDAAPVVDSATPNDGPSGSADSAPPADARPADTAAGADAAAGADVGSDGPTRVDSSGARVPIKFCNALMPTIVIEVGNPPSTVTLMAASGACSSATGAMCTTVPDGTQDVRVVVNGAVAAMGTATFNPTREYVVLAGPNPMTGMNDVRVGPLPVGTSCADFTPFAAPDGGAAADATPSDAAPGN